MRTHLIASTGARNTSRKRRGAPKRPRELFEDVLLRQRWHLLPALQHFHKISRDYTVREIADDVFRALDPCPVWLIRIGSYTLARWFKFRRPEGVLIEWLARQHARSPNTIRQYLFAARRRNRALGYSVDPPPLQG